MADAPEGLLGRLGNFFTSGYDPAAAYSGLLSDPATKDAMMARALAGMAGAFAEGAMPVPYKGGVPFAATLGKAGAAGYSAQDTLIKARTEAAQQALYGAQGDVARSNLAINKAMLPGLEALIAEGKRQAAAGPLGLLRGGGGTKPADGSGGTGAPAVSTEAVATDLPNEARAFLDTVAGPESKGAYNIRYTPQGGATFDSFDAHPRIMEPGPEGPSSAAGRYQMVASTYDPLAKKYGYKDFTPQTQDHAAWQLAQDTFKDKTGGDLLAALKEGKFAQVESALHGQWKTLNLGSFGANLDKYTRAGAETVASLPVPGGGQPPGLLAQVPNAAAQMADTGASPSGGLLAATPPSGGALPPGVPPITSIPGGTNGIVPRGAPGPQGGLLAPPPGLGPPGTPPVSTAAAGPSGGLLGPTLPPEALASLGLVPPPGGRPAQFAGPGAADPTAPPGAPEPNLVSGLRPPVTPTGGLLAPPGAGPPAGMPPAAAPGPGPAAPVMPPAAAVPTGPPPTVNLPPLPTTMPQVSNLTPPPPTPQQMIAQGVTGMMALTGRTPPAWMNDLARMPTQMALEQYKAWVGAQANMQTEGYKKQVEAATARVIEYEKSQGNLPADLSKMTAEQNLRLRNSLADKGVYVDPITGHTFALPGFAEAQAQIEAPKQLLQQQREIAVKAAEQAEIQKREDAAKQRDIALLPMQERAKALSAEYADTVQKPALNADTARRTLATLGNSIANFQTGKTAEERLGIAKLWADAVSTLGFAPSDAVRQMIASGETISKQGNTLGFEMAKELGSRESQMVIQQAIGSNPGLVMSPQGNAMLLKLLDNGLQRDIAKRDFYDQYLQENKTYEGASAAFRKQNPIEVTVSSVPGLEYHPKTPAEIAHYPPGTRYIRTDAPGKVFTVPPND